MDTRSNEMKIWCYYNGHTKRVYMLVVLELREFTYFCKIKISFS